MECIGDMYNTIERLCLGTKTSDIWEPFVFPVDVFIEDPCQSNLRTIHELCLLTIWGHFIALPRGFLWKYHCIMNNQRNGLFHVFGVCHGHSRKESYLTPKSVFYKVDSTVKTYFITMKAKTHEVSCFTAQYLMGLWRKLKGWNVAYENENIFYD